MASRYWVGGSAAWDGVTTANWAASSGGAPGASVPAVADDVFLDGNSGTGTVTLSAASTGRSLDCTGFAGTLSHPAATTVSLGTSSAPVSGVLLRLAGGMTYTLGNAGTSAWNFTNTVSANLTTGGQTLGNITYAVAGTLLFQDATTCGAITHTAGTLNMNGQTVNAASYTGSSGTRTWTLGAATVTFSGGLQISGGSFTLSAGTSTVTVKANTAVPGSLAWYNFVLNPGTGTVSFTPGSGNTFNNLTLTTTANKTGVLQIRSAITVNGTLTVAGNSVTNRLYVNSSAIGSPVTISCANAPVLSNADFADIIAAGAGGAWSGTSIGDAGGNTSITAATPLTLYWVGGTANWSSSGWSTSSGGASGARVPLPQDNVIFDGNSSGTCTLDLPRLGANLAFTGFTGTFNTAGTAFTSFGSVTLAGGMALLNSGNWTLSGRGAQTFTSAGKLLTTSIILQTNGTCTLQDAISLTGFAGLNLQVNQGTLATGGNGVTTGNFVFTSGSAKTINLGSSLVTLTGTSGSPWNATATGTTFNAGSSTIRMASNSSAARTFAGAGLNYYGLWISNSGAGATVLTGSNSFNNLRIDGAAKTVQFTASTVQTCQSVGINGAPGAVQTLQSTSAGSAWTLKCAATVTVNFASVQDSTASGGTPFYASQSANVSGNSGWSFVTCASVGGLASLQNLASISF